MGLYKFLKSLRTLANNGDLTIDDAYRFAQQEFGEITDLLKLQINKIFKEAGAPSIKKPEPKGDVVPFKTSRDQEDFLQRVGRQIEQDRKDLGPIDTKEEGITFSVPEKGIFNQKTSIDEVTDMLTKNPFRRGGGLDLTTGMTRTAARVVLDRNGIKVPDRADAIDVFEENFGGDALMDLKDVADELVEKEQTGRITESMGEFLEKRGMFDLKVDKDAPKAMSDEELAKKLTDDDPDRNNNAMGGLNRIGYRDAGRVIRLASLLKQKGTTVAKAIKDAIDNFIQPSGDRKIDADVILDDMLEELNIDRVMIDQKDILDAYDEIYTTISKPDLPAGLDPRETILPTGDVVSKQLKVMRLAEDIQPGLFEKLNDTQLDIITKYGDMIDDDLLRNIVLDPDPNNQAAALATIEEAKIMLDKGMSVDEVLKVQGEALNRKKQAEGGLSYLMGM